jgi:hypothetical protein
MTYNLFGSSNKNTGCTIDGGVSSAITTTTRKMKNAFVFNEEEFRNAFKVQSNNKGTTTTTSEEASSNGCSEAELSTVKVNASLTEETRRVKVLEEEKVVSRTEVSATSFSENGLEKSSASSILDSPSEAASFVL